LARGLHAELPSQSNESPNYHIQGTSNNDDFFVGLIAGAALR
jgi:hypothetical protein